MKIQFLESCSILGEPKLAGEVGEIVDGLARQLIANGVAREAPDPVVAATAPTPPQPEMAVRQPQRRAVMR